ncbi:MAG: DUF1304 domain-containing protein [Leptospiraceae bacterium]|nr:DUF1304 domain-containing protein [Leptospiraceae bacterium]
MKIAALILTILVIVEHIYFWILEMFLWTIRGPKVFGFTPEYAESTKVLAANQGLYNAFLAAGLIWALTIRDTIWKYNISLFFLICIVIAGIYGGLSSNIKIMYIQGVPALLAMTLVILVKNRE